MVDTLSEKPRSTSKECIALDVAFLDENTFGDKQLRDEILGLFRTQLQSIDESLQKSIDAKAWKHLTHTLKGAASAVGACDIVKLAAKWEQQEAPATSQQLSVCRLAFADAVFEFETACAALVA